MATTTLPFDRRGDLGSVLSNGDGTAVDHAGMEVSVSLDTIRFRFPRLSPESQYYALPGYLRTVIREMPRRPRVEFDLSGLSCIPLSLANALLVAADELARRRFHVQVIGAPRH